MLSAGEMGGSPADQIISELCLHRAIEWPAIISHSIPYSTHSIPSIYLDRYHRAVWGLCILDMHVLKLFAYSPTQSLSTRASVLPTQTPLPDLFSPYMRNLFNQALGSNIRSRSGAHAGRAKQNLSFNAPISGYKSLILLDGLIRHQKLGNRHMPRRVFQTGTCCNSLLASNWPSINQSIHSYLCIMRITYC